MKSHCTGKHRELLTPPYNFTFKSVISESQNVTLLLVIFFYHTCVPLFLKTKLFFLISLPTWHLTYTEPIIMNYSKNTFIATFSLSYMTQLRKSTLINPSTVTTLKQKEKKMFILYWVVLRALIILEISCLFVGICICFSVVEFKVHRKTSHGSNTLWCRFFD